MSSTVHITVIDREDVRHEFDLPTDMDLNMMEACKANELDVDGTCGGMALCSTCHLYILSDQELPESSDDEEDMLDQAFFVEDNSRLGCQLKITDVLDGLVCKLAPKGL